MDQLADYKGSCQNSDTSTLEVPFSLLVNQSSAIQNQAEGGQSREAKKFCLQGHTLMMELAVFLKHLATAHNLAILLTNHMAAGKDQGLECTLNPAPNRLSAQNRVCI